MFNRLRNRKRNKEVHLEKAIMPFSSIGRLFLTFSLIPIGLAGASKGLMTGNFASMAMFSGALFGGTVRFSRDFDDYIVGRHINGKGSRFTEYCYSKLSSTPLRFYTVNQMSKRLEDLEAMRQEKSVKHIRKNLKIEETSPNIKATIMEARTVNYIRQVTDSRRHLRYIIGVVLAGTAIMRTVALSTSGDGITPWKIFNRAAGVSVGATISLSHVHAYVKKRAAETDPRPFFVISAKWAEKLPTKAFADWMIRRDVRKIMDLEEGRQVWGWRFAEKTVKNIPVPFVRTAMEKHLDNRRMELNDNVREQLESRGITQRVEDLKGFSTKSGITFVSNTSIRSAYNDLMGKMADQLQGLQESLGQYKASVEERNEAKIELYNIFNSKEALPLPFPMNDNVIPIDETTLRPKSAMAFRVG